MVNLWTSSPEVHSSRYRYALNSFHGDVVKSGVKGEQNRCHTCNGNNVNNYNKRNNNNKLAKKEEEKEYNGKYTQQMFCVSFWLAVLLIFSACSSDPMYTYHKVLPYFLRIKKKS